MIVGQFACSPGEGQGVDEGVDEAANQGAVLGVLDARQHAGALSPALGLVEGAHRRVPGRGGYGPRGGEGAGPHRGDGRGDGRRDDDGRQGRQVQERPTVRRLKRHLSTPGRRRIHCQIIQIQLFPDGQIEI